MVNTFLRPQSEYLGDRCADAVYRAIEGGGAELMTLGGIGERIRMTKSGLHRAAGGREGLIQLVVRVFGDRWLRWSTNPYTSNDDILQLPETEEEVTAVRTWAALTELAAAEARAGRPAATQRVAGYRREEARDLAGRLTDTFGRRPLSEELISVLAMVDGLRAAVAAPMDAVPVWAARRILAAHVEHLRTVGPRPTSAAPVALRPSGEGRGLDEARAVPRDQPTADQLRRE